MYCVCVTITRCCNVILMFVIDDGDDSIIDGDAVCVCVCVTLL
jgi:hypothetical protein